MFREDFEFHEGAAASHLGRSGGVQHASENSVAPVATAVNKESLESVWAPDAEKELSKIPFFVRGKARRNTERYAKELGVPIITIETLYDAKAHLSRQ
jgi:light-independent protochlorophyllide reductase subunit B